MHILTGPIVLFIGLILLSETFRRKYAGWHRGLGRVQVVVLLLLVLPSSIVMARRSSGGWPSGWSFVLLSIATAICAVLGVWYARLRQFANHRRWMLRCYVLICSAVALRLLSGAASWIGVSNPDRAYTIAAWCSWLLPLAALEVVLRRRNRVGNLMVQPLRGWKSGDATLTQGALRDPGLTNATPSA